MQPARIVVAAPVAAAETCRSLAAEADEVVCVNTPRIVPCSEHVVPGIFSNHGRRSPVVAGIGGANPWSAADAHVGPVMREEQSYEQRNRR